MTAKDIGLQLAHIHWRICAKLKKPFLIWMDKVQGAWLGKRSIGCILAFFPTSSMSPCAVDNPHNHAGQTRRSNSTFSWHLKCPQQSPIPKSWVTNGHISPSYVSLRYLWISVFFSTGTFNFGFYLGLGVEGLVLGEMEKRLGTSNVVFLGKSHTALLWKTVAGNSNSKVIGKGFRKFYTLKSVDRQKTHCRTETVKMFIPLASISFFVFFN